MTYLDSHIQEVERESAYQYLLNFGNNLPPAIRQQYLQALDALQNPKELPQVTLPIHMKREGTQIEGIQQYRDDVKSVYIAAQRVEAENRRHSMEIELQHRLIEHREQERVKIAHYLHEHPLQGLISLMYVLSMAADQEENDRERENLLRAQEEARALVIDLRNFCNELRPPVLTSFGLQLAIRSHIEGLIKLHPEIKFKLALDMDRGRLTDTIRLTLYRIYQEAITNVIQHSNARNVQVIFAIRQDHARLEINDDGLGFEPETQWDRLTHDGSLGLISMFERAGAVSGRLSLVSSPGCGTKIGVSIPI